MHFWAVYDIFYIMNDYICIMKILTGTQIKVIDAYTIEHEPISSIALMERAAMAIVEKIMAQWDESTPVKIFAGPGNNGGDALAIARLLSERGYKVWACLFNTSDNLSHNCEVNKDRLAEMPNVDFYIIESQFTPPQLQQGDLVIDGLFGTGVNKPLNGGFAMVVKYINASPATVLSIDCPSGLMCDDNTNNVMNHIVRADYTYTFQYPKLSFIFPENAMFLGKWEVLDIGLIDPQNDDTETPYHIVELADIQNMLKDRSKFAHKGNMGHAVLVAGKKNMAGAAILAGRACLRGGVGKLSIHTPEANVLPLQIAVPEAVLDVESGNYFSSTFDITDYDAMAIGPGIGTESETAQAFIEQISLSKLPLVLDADALNILGSHRGWINQLPRHSILTPHKKELFGLISITRNSYEELERTRELAVRQQIYIVIKGANSAVCLPDGSVYFNCTGNPGMATAGSGDVLTGLILALLAQDYKSDVAVRLGVYLHGLAGDLAAEEKGHEGLIASDIIEYLPKAFVKIRNKRSK